MSAHTSGPWTFGSLVIVADVSNTFNVAVASVSSARTSPEISADERNANGRLIAAAPELLAACEALVAFAADGGLACGHIAPGAAVGCPLCLSSAAIEKARGA